MLVSDVITKFKNREIALHRDASYQEELLILILRAINPNQKFKDTEGNYFWLNENLEKWNWSNSVSPIKNIVKVSEIKENYETLIDGRIQMTEDEFELANFPDGFEKIRQYHSLNLLWIDGYSQDYKMRNIYRKLK